MKAIFFITFIIIGSFIYIKLNPIEPINETIYKETRIIDKSIIQTKIDTKTLQHRFDKLYQCDGRTHCSQMHSCEEATFFLQNCKETKMDGNKDGVPCERQWCH